MADWIAAPSSGGWTGPEKIIGPPAVRTLRSHLGVREDHRAARGGERLVQRAGRDHARVPAERVQRRAAAVLARPADAVRVVDVEVQLLVAVQQRRAARRTARSRRTSSRRRRPCTRCGCGVGARRSIIASRRSMLLWRISSTVAPLTRSWLAAICTLAWTWWSSITASRGLDDHRQRRQVAERGRRRDQHVAAEHLVQQRLELVVLRRLQIGARGRELRPITRRRRRSRRRACAGPARARGSCRSRSSRAACPSSETVRPSSA